MFRNTGFEQPVDGIGFPDIETDIIQVVIGGDVIPSAFPPEDNGVPVSLGQRKTEGLLRNGPPRGAGAGTVETDGIRVPVDLLFPDGTVAVPEERRDTVQFLHAPRADLLRDARSGVDDRTPPAQRGLRQGTADGQGTGQTPLRECLLIHQTGKEVSLAFAIVRTR